MANITKKHVIILSITALLGSLVGFGGGVAYVGATKAARLADDVHEVKEDWDKGKKRFKKDYTHVTDKGKEVLDKMDTADIGSAATTGVKELGKDAADGLREIGGTWKERLKAKMAKKTRCAVCASNNPSDPKAGIGCKSNHAVPNK